MGLVLTRKTGERIVIGDDVTIEVVAIADTKVRLMVDAPRGVEIDREELRERKDREGRR